MQYKISLISTLESLDTLSLSMGTYKVYVLHFSVGLTLAPVNLLLGIRYCPPTHTTQVPSFDGELVMVSLCHEQ